MSTALSTVERVRRLRDRRKTGACVLNFVSVNDETGLIETLIVSGLLAETERDDKSAMSRAAGRLLDVVVKERWS
jgi:hypothetical protein